MTEKKLFTCRHCNEDKPAEDMQKNKRMKYGVEYICLACRSARRHKNGDYMKERLRKYEYRKGGETVLITLEELNELLQRKNCQYCDVELTRGESLHSATTATLDHVYPLGGHYGGYGGENIAKNIAITCHSCNSSKDNDHIYDFYRRSDKFTPELWTKFVREFTERLTGKPLSDIGVERMKQNFADEAEELRRNIIDSNKREVI